MRATAGKRRFFGCLGFSAALAVGFLAVVAAPSAIVVRQWSGEAVALVEAHRRHEVSHPGWSFPARVQSGPGPVAGKRAVAEARARGYLEDCTDTRPGEFCGKTSKVVPRYGNALEPIVLGTLMGPDAEEREHLPLAEAPRALIDAIEVAEDREFREHSGVNWRAMARAALANAQEGEFQQGGSTLTMQVVRNLDQRREKTVLRKLREMVLAWSTDRYLGKDGVMQMYLDAPYLGQRGSIAICGFRAAAKHYFGEDITELELDEIATLAAILPAPGKFSPDRFPERARERRDRVLRAMQALRGYDVEAALVAPIRTVAPTPPSERYAAYLGATRALLEGKLSPEVLYGAGLVVTTGLDVMAQEEAEKLFPAKTKFFQGLVGRPAGKNLEAAGVLLDVDSGLIRAIYGGEDLSSVEFNRATQAMRQPGSSFKPLVYALAFQQRNPDGTPRFTAASTEPNSPRDFKTPQGTWRPRNVGGEYSPTASLAQGLAWSQNIATASLLEEMGGPAPLIAFAAQVGFDTSKFPAEMGLALGQAEVTPLHMAQFAATVSNGGRKVTGSTIVSVVNAAGVQVLGPPQPGAEVISPGAAALARELMRLVIEVGTGGATRGAAGEVGYQGPAIGKTGTTDGEKDLWLVGATPTRAMVVWLGYDEPAPLGAAASDLAAPLWGWWMARVAKYDPLPLPDWTGEPKVVRRAICKETGKLMNATCPGIPGPFLEGTAPRAACPLEHPPPPPEDTVLDENGEPKPKHESLWKRLARKEEEKAAAPAAGDTPPVERE
jgi:membrane peptidoglycan carboxypeptidase